MDETEMSPELRAIIELIEDQYEEYCDDPTAFAERRGFFDLAAQKEIH